MLYSTLSTVFFLLPLGYAVPLTSTPSLNVSNPKATNTIQDSYIVVYKSNANDAAILSHESTLNVLGVATNGLKGLLSRYNLAGFRGYQVQTNAAGISKISQSPLVDYIEKDQKVSISDLNILGYTTRAASTWGLNRISQKSAVKSPYSYSYDASACQGTRAYIIDTGVRTDHNEFKSNSIFPTSRAIWGANFITGSPNTDEHGHGTHVGGIVGGLTYGVCSKTTIVAVKALDKDGYGAWSGIISAIQWAVSDATVNGGTRKAVINLSIGGDYSAAVNAAVSSAVNAGVTVAVAAGNNGANATNFSPASEPSVITVGATDVSDNKPSWSNFGASLDIFAPGDSILSAGFSCTTCTATMSGTSMASPHIAGLAAYLISKEGLSSPAAVASRIQALATSGKINSPGTGSVNLIAYNGIGRN